MPAPIRLLAPAKINLSLDVLGQRADGYHWVEMVLQTIGLYDHLTLEGRSDGQIQVVCRHPFVPSGRDNLAYRAADALRQLAGDPSLGATITIVKGIPAAAGLGGGSADGAAVLKGLNRLWGLGLPPVELAQAGLALGADFPFCLLGGTALARGIGEELIPLPAPPKLWVVLLKPGAGVSTAQVYADFCPAAVRRRPDTPGLVKALALGDLEGIPGAMANVLESVTLPRLPLLKQLKAEALANGALAAQMSGSGPTVFALAADYRSAQAIYSGLKHRVDFAHITTFEEVSPA